MSRQGLPVSYRMQYYHHHDYLHHGHRRQCPDKDCLHSANRRLGVTEQCSVSTVIVNSIIVIATVVIVTIIFSNLNYTQVI